MNKPTIGKLRIHTANGIGGINNILYKHGIYAKDVINIETKQPAGIYVIWYVKKRGKHYE